MRPDAGVSAALQPFAQRAVGVAFVRSALLTVPLAAMLAEILWLARIGHSPVMVAGLVGAALALSVLIAAQHRPALIDVARRVDRRGGLQDLIVSAVQSSGDGLATLVRSDAIAALKRHAPRDIYSVELPHRWRQWAAAALVAQAVAIVFTWQPPAERAQQSSATSLILPSGNDASSTPAPKPDSARSTPEPADTPALNAGAAAAAPARPASTSVTTADTPAASDGAAEGAGRLRLAAANAEFELTAGRIPAARRAIVGRYFAALQSQRKTPR